MNRRTYLRAAGLGLAAIAGCTSGDGGTNPGDDTQTTVPDTTTPDTTDRTTTAAPTTGTTTSTTRTSTRTTTGTTTPPGLGPDNGSFENGLLGWNVGRDLPMDPNKSSGVVDSEARVVDRTASDGDRALELYIDGRQDDGTLWVQREVDFAGVDTLAVDYLTSESFNVILKAATYAGPVPDGDLGEQDFDTSEPLQRETGGWQTFEYPVDHDGHGLLAVGVTVIWETEIAGVLDNVRLR